MKSLLGVHSQFGGGGAVEYVRRTRAAILATMSTNLGFLREIKNVSPSTFVLLRVDVDDLPELPDATQDSLRVFNYQLPHLAALRGLFDAAIFRNEQAIASVARAQFVNQQHVVWGGKMRDFGFPSAAYSCSTGVPEPEHIPHMRTGLAACKYLCLDEYSAPHMMDGAGWLCLRYRNWLSILAQNRQMIVGKECGIDGGPIGRHQEGWRRFTDSNGYLADLQWYDRELQRDRAFVMGWAIFQLEPWGIAGSFGMGELDNIANYIAAGGDPAPPSVRVSPCELAAELVRKWEGFAMTPQGDLRGTRVIGYGHQIQPGENWLAITQPQAEALLQKDLLYRLGYLRRLVRVPLNDFQTAALLDFIYNLGVGAFTRSDLLAWLNQGEYGRVPYELGRWIYGRDAAGNKVVMQGLVRRRADEVALFNRKEAQNGLLQRIAARTVARRFSALPDGRSTIAV